MSSLSLGRLLAHLHCDRLIPGIRYAVEQGLPRLRSGQVVGKQVLIALHKDIVDLLQVKHRTAVGTHGFIQVFWLVQGAVAFAGDSSAKAKGTLTETSIPIESWQLAELTWGEPGENSAPQGQLITTGGDPQMILEDVSGRVVRTVSYNVEFDGDSREMCLYYTTKTGEPYSQDRRVFPKVLADGTYVYTLPRTQIVALRLDPCSPDENKTVGLTFTPQSITLNAASTLPGGADYFIPTWYRLFGLIVYPALAAAALDWLWAVGRQLAKKKQ